MENRPMSALPDEKPTDESDRLEAATTQAIEACAALKAALIAMTMMESELSDVYASVSHGFARGKLRESWDG
jgi:hypothetical protein